MLPTLLLCFSLTVEPIRLDVDATDAGRGVFRVTETLPVVEIVSMPQWLPGHHLPDGPISEFAGFHVTADGKPVGWRRDSVDMFTFHLDPPRDAQHLEIRFNALKSPLSPNMGRLDWESCVLLPTRRNYDAVHVQADVSIPKGWVATSALDGRANGGQTQYEEVSAYTLIDSPVQMGRIMRSYPLGDIAGAPVGITLAGDSAAAIDLPAASVDGLKRMVQQAGALFGGRHFRHYRFMVVAPEIGSGAGGLEHHECSEDRIPASTVSHRFEEMAALLGHEFAHSWNGKYRRPNRLAVKSLNEPMKDDLLWVYEGLTEYLGILLPARARIFDPHAFMDTLAAYAIFGESNSGRTWRPLADTARGLPAYLGAKNAWKAEARGTDYYEEGALVWLEADAIIRARTKGAKCLDDFVRLYAGGIGAPEVRPYGLGEIVKDLNRVCSFDWNRFLEMHVEELRPGTPVEGFEAAGYRLTYDDVPTVDVWHSYDSNPMLVRWGADIGDDGSVSDVILDSPAYIGGLGPGMKILTLNGKTFSKAALVKLLSTAGEQLLSLHVQNGPEAKDLTVACKCGPYHPHLERDPTKPDLLTAILAPLEPKSN